MIASLLSENGLKNRRAGFGLEAGRVLADNLWLIVGYNWRDLVDKDLLTDYSSRGAYLKLRYKFDENLFKSQDAQANRTLVPTNP